VGMKLRLAQPRQTLEKALVRGARTSQQGEVRLTRALKEKHPLF
jgi:hypothetical protein